IIESIYNLYLLYIIEGQEVFRITAIQIDNTLSFITPQFSQKEEEELIKKGLYTKLKTVL
ncbi:hypothetical protein CCHL11_02500, partial [Colletotrichum chlorophyti]